MPRTLVVTNDFPPRRGGIETFVHSLCHQLPADEVVVYTAAMPGDATFDATLPFPVVRDPAGTLLPHPALARRTARTLTDQHCDRVLFGAAAPLGLLAAGLRAAGARRLVALTHGHETWWSKVPGPRAALRHIARSCDALTYVSQWCRREIARGLPAHLATRLHRLAPGVDTGRFHPGCGGVAVRERLGLTADQPVVVCAARMVARKGQDTLVRAWPGVLEVVPDAVLLLVGDGPHRRTVERLAASTAPDAVRFAGGVTWTDVPAYIDAGDVFAMPCRTRLAGLEPEALGIVCLEAAACGLPVVVGDSGGAPETVRHNQTGFVVDPLNPAAVAARLRWLLTRPEEAHAMGQRGRSWIRSQWTWPAAGQQLRRLLAG